MLLSAFAIGTEFRCSGRLWRYTDVGSQVVVAIRVDEVSVAGSDGSGASAQGSSRKPPGGSPGQPHAVAEPVFDENDLDACSPDPDL